MLEKMEEGMGANHSGELRLEVAEAKAERTIKAELKRLGWKERDLVVKRKSDAGKLAIAGRLRRETTLTIGKIAKRLHLGSPKSANARIHEWMRSQRRVVTENLKQPEGPCVKGTMMGSFMGDPFDDPHDGYVTGSVTGFVTGKTSIRTNVYKPCDGCDGF
jgi:hypothetical protein